jgi:hypothetical protein
VGWIAATRCVRAAHPRPDLAAEAPAMDEEALVSEHVHQLEPEPGDGFGRDADGAGMRGEREAGRGREHHVEGVLHLAAMGDGVDKRLDEIEQLKQRARPVVREQEGRGRGAAAARVHDVDPHPAELELKRRERVEARRVHAPVVALGPVGDELLE